MNDERGRGGSSGGRQHPGDRDDGGRGSGSKAGRGLPPFWWVWVVALVAGLLALALIALRFFVLEPLPGPEARP